MYDDDDARDEYELIEAYGESPMKRVVGSCECTERYICRSCKENY